MRHATRYVLTALASLLCVAPFAHSEIIDDQQLIEAFRENPYRAAAGHCPYEAPSSFSDTRAPWGYKSVYISHFGRHGSRFQGGMSVFSDVCPLLDDLAARGLLTPCGDSLRRDLQLMWDLHKGGMEGMLTVKGGREHKGIAQRLCKRVPRVFRQRKSRKVCFTSTKVPRCIESMGYFASEINGFSNKLECSMDVGFKYPDCFEGPDLVKVREIVRHYEDSLLAAAGNIPSLAERLFTNTEEITGHFLFRIFKAAAGAADLDVSINPLRFFTPEELLIFNSIRNIHFCAAYGCYGPTRDNVMKHAYPYAMLFIKDADDALAGNGHCADFRFAHDKQLGPIMSLLDLEPYGIYTSVSASHNQFATWKYLSMATNLQAIFYRKRKSEVLVKFLCNERETTIPSLKAVNTYYYKWSDVREHILRRMGAWKELPSYYYDYLQEKAALICQLQQTEAAGFYFWTDQHYPANTRHAAPAIAYLQEACSPRMVFTGGDAIDNAPDYNPALAQYIQDLARARGMAGLYALRGNHDFTSYTGQYKPEIGERKTLSQWETAGVLSFLRSPGMVSDPSDPYSCYGYIDKAGIRYIFLDTTDDVVDNTIQYGMSERQKSWILNTAILAAPKGCKIVLVSHVPLLGPLFKERKIPSLQGFNAILTDANTFASRPDIQILFAISGHRHRDAADKDDGILQIITASDSYHPSSKAAVQVNAPTGTLEEQCLDYVSISKDFKTIHLVRIGRGENRILCI